MPSWHTHISTDEARRLPRLEDHTAWVWLEKWHDYGDPWSATRGLSMTERPTNRSDHVRTSLVSTPHWEGRVASRSFLWPL